MCVCVCVSVCRTGRESERKVCERPRVHCLLQYLSDRLQKELDAKAGELYRQQTEAVFEQLAVARVGGGVVWCGVV